VGALVVPANVSAAPVFAAQLPATVRGSALLDVHTDLDHERSVLTYGGAPEAIVSSALDLVAWAVASIDLHRHDGVHPRLGALDVLPFVPHDASVDDAVRCALSVAREAADRHALPVFLYGEASPRGRTLPDVRRDARDPDFGPSVPHLTAGRLCVGVRGPLIAFNVDLRGSLHGARAIARELRTVPGIRALGFALASRGLVQVSMNLIDPARTGPRAAFERVAASAPSHQLGVVSAEVVGLVPDASLAELDGLPLRAPPRGVQRAIEDAGI
jgi:glutamate formiminotransferase